jgi:uncharacterized protein
VVGADEVLHVRVARGSTRGGEWPSPAQVVAPRFEELCRQWARSYGQDAFGGLPAVVAAAVVDDPASHTQIQVDVAVLAPVESGAARRVLSIGEVKWGEPLGMRHLERLRRARDLLVAKGHAAQDAVLTCYGGGGFDAELRAAASAGDVVLMDPAALYGGGTW